MITWVLVLTLLVNDYRGGSSMESVHGFATEAACLDAGNAWVKQMSASLSDSYVRPRALCVATSSTAKVPAK